MEPLITKSKSDSTHSRRTVFSYLQNKEAVAELFREVAGKIGERPGGYTRIIKTGNRLGDAAEMCMMELVDFNTIFVKETGTAAKKAKTTRRGRAKKVEGAADAAPATPKAKKAKVENAEKAPDAEGDTKE